MVTSLSLPSGLRQTLRAALLDMHAEPRGQQVLMCAGMSRFVGVSDSDYDPIRDMWRRAARVEPWLDVRPTGVGSSELQRPA